MSAMPSLTTSSLTSLPPTPAFLLLTTLPAPSVANVSSTALPTLPPSPPVPPPTLLSRSLWRLSRLACCSNSRRSISAICSATATISLLISSMRLRSSAGSFLARRWTPPPPVSTSDALSFDPEAAGAEGIAAAVLPLVDEEERDTTLAEAAASISSEFLGLLGLRTSSMASSTESAAPTATWLAFLPRMFRMNPSNAPVSTPAFAASTCISVAALTIVVRASTWLKLKERSRPCKPTLIFSSVRCSLSTRATGAPSALSRLTVVLCLAMSPCCLLMRFSRPNMLVSRPPIDDDGDPLKSSSSGSSIALSLSSPSSYAADPSPPPPLFVFAPLELKKPPKMPPPPARRTTAFCCSALCCSATIASTSAGSTEKNRCFIASSADGLSPLLSVSLPVAVPPSRSTPLFLACLLAATSAAAAASSSYHRGRSSCRAKSHPAPSPASSTAVLLRDSCPLFASRHRNRS
mmetsp:Transcript_3008/g.7328  ORF Transcript_3008/g.7328 Transcript_3008/m.7328 type:complete len:464 (-) Transcript_3008:1159-2550(-)